MVPNVFLCIFVLSLPGATILRFSLPETAATTARPQVDSAVFFHNFGETIYTRGNAHVNIYLNLTAILDSLRQLRKAIHTNAHAAYLQTPLKDIREAITTAKGADPILTCWHNNAKAVCKDVPPTRHRSIEEYDLNSDIPASRVDFATIRTLDNVIRQLQDYLDLGQTLSVPNRPGPVRPKRFLPAILPAVQTFLGIVSTFQLWQIKRDLRSAHKKLNQLTVRVDDIEVTLSNQGQVILQIIDLIQALEIATNHHLARAQQQLFHSTAVTEAVELASRVSSAMEALLNHRLSPATLAAGQADHIVHTLLDQADAIGYRLLITNHADLFQCPTSFIADGHGFEVFVHVPMAMKGDSLMLYRFLPIPAQVSDNSAMVFAPEHDVIAVSGDDEVFQVLRMADLAQCTMKGTTYLCENNNVVRTRKGALENTDDSTNCLYFLMVRNMDAIKNSCPVKLSKVRDGAYQLNENKFVFQNRKSSQGTTTCADNSHPKRWPADEREVIDVPAGCSAETESFRVTATRSIKLSAKAVEFQWSDPVTNLFGPVNILKYDDLRQQARAGAALPRSINGMGHWLEQQEVEEHHRYFSKSGLGISLAIVLILTIVGVVIWWRARATAARFGISVSEMFRYLAAGALQRLDHGFQRIVRRRPPPPPPPVVDYQELAVFRRPTPAPRPSAPRVVTRAQVHRQSWAAPEHDSYVDSEPETVTLDRRQTRRSSARRNVAYSLPPAYEHSEDGRQPQDDDPLSDPTVPTKIRTVATRHRLR